MKIVLWLLVGANVFAAAVALYVSLGLAVARDALQVLAMMTALNAVTLAYLLVRGWVRQI